MKKWLVGILTLCMAQWVAAAPLRVALLDFENQSGMRADPALGGLLEGDSLALKGVYLLGKELLNQDAFVLVDRRDFIRQIDEDRAAASKDTRAKVSFLHAAQALGADVVVRGSLISFSTGKQAINQGGYHTDFSTLSVRVVLEALDATDGSVVSLTEGAARRSFRQTAEMQTVLSEDDVLGLLSEAVGDAVPELEKALSSRMARDAARRKVKLNVVTTADPALIELDGILIGSTPLENFEVYAGDHVLTVGKPGHRDITKRVLLEKDTRVEVPMLRVELSAEELKDVLGNVRFNHYSGVEPALIIQTIEERISGQ